MRISIISIIVMLTMVCSGIAQSKTDWQLMNLKAKVKNISATEYQMNETDTENKTLHYKFDFNNKGYKTSESLREGDQMKFATNYKYSAKNELTEENSRYTRSSSTRKYKYDTKNRTTTIAFYANSTQITKTTQKYDENGNVLERHVENLKEKEKNAVIESYWCKYDESNNLIEEKQLIGADEKLIKYKYDENGFKLERNEFDKEGLPTYWHKYKYDENGNVSEEVTAYRGYETTVLTYVYIYDDKGNWTEMREQEAGKTQALTIREIKYY